MDYKKLFRAAEQNGFHRDDVIHYLKEMEKNTQDAEAVLKDQIELLTQSREELTQEVSEFSNQVKGLEQQLKEEKDRVHQVSSMRDYLYTELEHKQQELDEEVKARQNDMAACKREIERYLTQKKKLQNQVEQLSVKNQKYDEIQNSLKRIRMKAESEAFQMLETAKEQSMDAISVVDDVVEEIEVFQSDIGQIKADLQIGPHTAEDRLNGLYDALDQYVGKLKGIKEHFYQVHHLSDGQDGYDYMGIAPDCQEKQQEDAEAEEELPAGGGRENLLPISKSVECPIVTQRNDCLENREVCQEAADE
ncbi:MAG: hypothetical protein HFE39_02115 [Clostridiales bacterium]|jgi:chromosome segregation ATPase|nr:hypothetical protein [Clostridiales bacterium]